MSGEPDTAGAFQTDIPFGIPFLAEFGHLTAKCLLVALTQPEMVMVEYISAKVVARPHRTHVPAPVDRQQEITGQCHDRQFHHQMQEDLVAVLDDDVVSEAAVVTQALSDKPFELAVQVINPLGQLCRLCCRAACHEAVRHIAVLLVAELLRILADAEAVQGYAVERCKVDSGKNL